LTVEATRTSFLYALVVKDRKAAAALGEISMPWKTGALTAIALDGGGLELRDREGKKAASVPAPQMWDATVEPHSGEHVRRSGLGMRVVAKDKGKDLVLTPPRAFLDDPATVYPVTIDPGPTDFTPNFDAYVQSDTTSDQSASTELRIGTFDSGATKARSYLSFWLGGFLHGSYIQSANLFLWNHHSWSCTAKTWQVYWSPYVNSSLRWTNQPTGLIYVNQSSQTLGYSGCGENWVWAESAAGVQKLADDPASSTVNFRLSAASETNNLYWKKFNSAQGAHQPILRLFYTMKPTVSQLTTTPATSCVTGSGRPYVNKMPTLSARVTDPEGASVTVVHLCGGGVVGRGRHRGNVEWSNTGGAVIGSASLTGPTTAQPYRSSSHSTTTSRPG
jgi:hypothetical protein